jgi:hypothetical protein
MLVLVQEAGHRVPEAAVEQLRQRRRDRAALDTQEPLGPAERMQQLERLVEHERGRHVALQQGFVHRRVRPLPARSHRLCVGPAVRADPDAHEARVRRQPQVAPLGEYPGGSAHGFEFVVEFSQRFARPQEQQPPGAEAEMKQGKNPGLHRRLKIDQHVAAADHVQLGEWRVGHQVVTRKDDHVTQ